jgi:hypothetical protein
MPDTLSYPFTSRTCVSLSIALTQLKIICSLKYSTN